MRDRQRILRAAVTTLALLVAFAWSRTAGATITTSSGTAFAFPADVHVGGTSGTVVVNVINSTGSDKIASVSASTDCTAAFAFTNLPQTVTSASQVGLNVVFSPQLVQSYSCAFALLNMGGMNVGTIVLTANGIGPIIGVPASATFGSVRTNDTADSGGSTAQDITITNTGTGALSITNLAVTGSGFSLTNANPAFPFSVPAGGFVTVNVTFNPSTLGALAGSLAITASDATTSKDYSKAVPLSGTGTGAVLTLSPTTKDYGVVPVGGAGTSNTFTLTNSQVANQGPLGIDKISMTAASTWFTFNSTGSVTGCTAQSCSPSALTINATPATIGITCNPPTSATGSQSTTLTIDSDTDGGSTTMATLMCTAGHATLAFSTTTLAFPDTRQGTTSAALGVKITNSGNAAGLVTFAATGSADFASACVGANTNIPAGGSATCNFTFTPSAPVGGKAATFVASTNDTANGTVNIMATGNNVTPLIMLSATTLPFGTIDIPGTSGPQTLTLTNVGTQDLKITSATLPVGAVYAFTAGSAGVQTVTPGNSVSWMITCKPGVPGSNNGVLNLVTDAFTNANPAITLACTGDSATLAGNPSPVAFGPQIVNSTTPKTLTLSNTGNIDIAIATATFADTTKGYSLEAGSTAPFTVPANGTKVLTIDFKPLAVTDGGDVILSFAGTWMGAANHPITLDVHVTGSALNADVALLPDPLDFGAIRYDATVPATLCIQNGSDANVKLQAEPTITPETVITMTQTGEFTITQRRLAATCAATTGTNFTTYPQTIVKGGVVQLTIQAKPANRVGMLKATLMITTDGSVTSHTSTLTAMSTSGTLAISQAAVDFGAVDVDDMNAPATITVTITNTGTAPFDLNKFDSSTTDGALVITLPGDKTLAPGGSTTVELAYDPVAVAAEAGMVTFQTAHLQAGPANGTISIAGRGIDRTFAFSPADESAVMFPPTFRNPGTAAPIQSVTVQNLGEATLHIKSVALTGSPEFALVDTSSTTFDIPGNMSHDFAVRFTPTVAGAAPQGTLTFMGDDNDHPMASVTIDGLGVLPNVGITQAMAFGPTAIGVPSTIPAALLVSNMDTVNAFKIRKIEITGPDADAFTIKDAPADPDGVQVLAASSAGFDVTFTPTEDRAYSATVNLYLDQDPDVQATIPVTAQGVFVDLHGGGGCSTSNGSGGACVLLVGAALWFRRRKKRLATLAVMAAATTASADAPTNLDVGVFNPTPSTTVGGFQIISPEVGKTGDWVAGGVVSYASNPLVAESSLGTAKLVGTRTMFDVGGAYAFLGRFEAGARIPLYSQSGDTGQVAGFPAASGTARGDVTLHAKAKLVDTNYLTLGLGVEVTLPTATADQYAGTDKPAVTGLVLASLVPMPRLAFTANVGGIGRAKTDAANISQGSGLVWGAGVSFRTLDRLWIAAEVFGELMPSGHHELDGTMMTTTGLSPIEGLVGVHVRAARQLTIGAAIGRGLTTGVGSPDLRGVLAITFAPGTPKLEPIHPPPPPKIDGDADHDGIKDSVDKCPNEPEDKDGFQDEDGCPDPDNDHDGIPDAQDKCPNEAEDKDGFEDADGCPDLDNDQDGIPDAKDKCPNQPEDKDGFQDDDGCPDPDNDHDGIPDAQDKCPNDPETINGNADDDGCPDKGDSVVLVSPDRLEMLEPVTFSGTKLTKASFNVLGQVAATLRAHPEIIRIRVTTHVQPTANAAKDQETTDKRATAVRDWLVQWGIASGRIDTRGFGGTKPLVPAGSSGAAMVNDRLELIILERK